MLCGNPFAGMICDRLLFRLVHLHMVNLLFHLLYISRCVYSSNNNDFFFIAAEQKDRLPIFDTLKAIYFVIFHILNIYLEKVWNHSFLFLNYYGTQPFLLSWTRSLQSSSSFSHRNLIWSCNRLLYSCQNSEKCVPWKNIRPL